MYNRTRQLAILLFFLSPFWGPMAYAWYQTRAIPFTEQGWKAGDDVVRGRMYKSTEFRSAVLGSTEEDLLQKLGVPYHRQDLGWTYIVQMKYDVGPSSVEITFRERKASEIALRAPSL